jgi:hypothetical protein
MYRIESPATLTVLEALYGLFCAPAKATSASKVDSAPSRSPEKASGRSLKKSA